LKVIRFQICNVVVYSCCDLLFGFGGCLSGTKGSAVSTIRVAATTIVIRGLFITNTVTIIEVGVVYITTMVQIFISVCAFTMQGVIGVKGA
jgi:hypothetical protein